MLSELQQRDILRLSNEESQKLSRECLETALFKLMAKKEYDRISISEIVELAGVSRNALYRNYGTKEALLDGLANTIAEKLREDLPKYGSTDAESFKAFFQLVKEKADSFRILLIVRYPLAGRMQHNEEKSYMQSAWEGAFSAIVLQWFHQGMKETPADMGELCARLLSRLHAEDAGGETAE